jgi:phospholipase/carboxylesterase
MNRVVRVLSALALSSAAAAGAASAAGGGGAAAAAAASPRLLRDAYLRAPEGEHRVTVVWLHGLGDSSAGFSDLFEEHFPALREHGRVVIPNAPTRPITVNGGMIMRAWYDIVSLGGRDEKALARSEDEQGIRESAALVHELLEHESSLIDSNRIVLGGFSQGGAVSILAGLSYRKPLGAIVSCSGYGLLLSKLPEWLSPAARAVPVHTYHGAADEMVPLQFARASYERLRQHKLDVRSREEPRLGHGLSAAELRFLDQVWSPLAAAAAAAAKSAP